MIWGYGGQCGSNLPMIINEMFLISVESVYVDIILDSVDILDSFC